LLASRRNSRYSNSTSMVPDHLCCPGLNRPVSVSDYAQLKGVREAEGFAGIRALKIPAAFFRGQWYVEAPPNTEARLAQLRTAQQQTAHNSGNPGTGKEGGLADWVRGLADAREHVQTDLQPQRESRLSELPRRDPIGQPKPVRAPVPQPVSNTQETPRPQPVDYGLTYDDLNLYSSWESRNAWLCRLDDGKVIRCLGTRPDDRYKKGRRWFRVLHPLDACAYKVGGFAFWALLFGVLMTTSGQASRLVGLILLGFGLACVPFAILPGVVIEDLRKRASPALKKYWQVLHAYDDNKAAAEKANREAARDAELRKHSYWAFLDGYEFEQATAEVLRKHQFTAIVTPGSADGGIDIEVTRNGLKGVIQCKAHVACVGPHVVRDLYGVIHHCGASFGIIVSRGGFTRGAIDFARDKPILFLDTDGLIAMQEGRDVLAEAFTPKERQTDH
jgi:hypothetical protein